MNAPAPRSGSQDAFSLAGKVAIVTGGSGVLGSAIARGLGRAGAAVAVAGTTAEKAERAAAHLRTDGLRTLPLTLDARDRDSVQQCLRRAEDQFGPVGILVNAVGGNSGEATVSDEAAFFDLPDEAIRSVVDLNLMAGAILPCQIIGRRMVEHGAPASIINISSMAADRPLTRVVGYSAAKAAVSNFTQWFAVYMARDVKSRVRVNAIAPGFFLTAQNRFLLTDERGGLTERGRAIVEQTPMGRFGDPEELVGAAVWLAGEASAFVTGVVLPVDGGFSAFSGV